MLPNFSSSRTGKLLLIVVLLIFTAALAVRARTWLALAPTAEPAASLKLKTASTTVVKDTSTQERVETVLVTITRFGFEPGEITRPQGKFFLEVDNRSELSEVDLRLEAEHGNRLHQKRVPREQLDWLQELELRPGSYTLTEANHPEWVCRITITAR
jgi:hypothetical protein